MNCLDSDKDIQINKIHRNIMENSKDVIKRENLTYKAEKASDRVDKLIDLS